MSAFASLAGGAPALAGTFVYVSNSEDGDISTYALKPDGELQPGPRVKAASERRPFSGTPQQIADDIGAYEKAGVSELVFDFRSERLDDALERMERFAQTIR